MQRIECSSAQQCEEIASGMISMMEFGVVIAVILALVVWWLAPPGSVLGGLGRD